MNKTLPFFSRNRKTMAMCSSGASAVLVEKLRVSAEGGGAALFGIANLESAVEYLASNPAQPLVVAAARFDAEIVEFLEAARRSAPDAPIIVVLEQVSVSDAVLCIRNGAFECLGPDATRDEISNILAAFCHSQERLRANIPLATEPWRKGLVGEGPALEAVANIIRLVGPRRCTVLITGETGTGKEMAARAIHQAGNRRRKPMVSVNCSALPENLIEAELFGHVNGAFTGAIGNRVGRFEQADGGTIFLDEIGEFPMHLQTKLLRVLQEREVQRLGGTETIKLDIRVIAATNADLLAKVQQGTFREDLYYRLNVVPIQMTALRDRAMDIPLLINHFVRKVCMAEGLAIKTVSASAMRSACAYTWPGNVRQLENIVKQAVVMHADHDCLDGPDFILPAYRQADRAKPIGVPDGGLGDAGMDFSETLKQFARGILDQAVVQTRSREVTVGDDGSMPRFVSAEELLKGRYFDRTLGSCTSGGI